MTPAMACKENPSPLDESCQAANIIPARAARRLELTNAPTFSRDTFRPTVRAGSSFDPTLFIQVPNGVCDIII
jgi:hypothetical protein